MWPGWFLKTSVSNAEKNLQFLIQLIFECSLLRGRILGSASFRVRRKSLNTVRSTATTGSIRIHHLIDLSSGCPVFSFGVRIRSSFQSARCFLLSKRVMTGIPLQIQYEKNEFIGRNSCDAE